MAQGAGTPFRTVMASLIMLAALVLFGVPSGAYAHTAGHHVSQTIAASPAAPQSADMRATSLFLLEKSGAGAVVVSAAPAAPSNHDGCSKHSGSEHSRKAPAPGCCFGTACPMMHDGVIPVGLLLRLPSDATTVSMPSSLLSEGIGTLPVWKPPRRSV